MAAELKAIMDTAIENTIQIMNMSTVSFLYNTTSNDTTTTSSPLHYNVNCNNETFKHACLYFLSVFGIAGNIFSFVVLHLKYPQTVANFLLKALAIADSSFLLTAFIAILLKDYSEARAGPLAYVAFTFTIEFILSDVAQFVSVWLIVVLSFSRYVAVAKPFHTSQYFTKKMVWITTAAIVTIAVVLESIRMSLIMKCKKETNDKNQTLYKCETETHKAWVNYLDFTYYAGILFLIPAIPLFVCNIGLLKALRTARQERAPNMPALTQEFREITKTVLVIVTVFMISYFPYLILGLSRVVVPFQSYLYKNWCVCMALYDSVVIGTHINSSINFLIYLFCKNSFRSKSKSLLLTRKNTLSRSFSRSTKYTIVASPNLDPSPINGPSPTFLLQKF